jgi:hypothetical protein
MATVIAGDSAARHARPPLSLLVCCIAPLAQDKEGIESALAFAEAGLPVGFMSMANTGSTAPATIAGTVVTGDAEIVSAMTLIQMAYPGASTFHSFMPGIMHPRSGAYLGSAWEGTLLYAVGVELAHNWGVPTLAGVFGTDAQVPGWQSAGTWLLVVAGFGWGGDGAGWVGGHAPCFTGIARPGLRYLPPGAPGMGLDTSQEALALDDPGRRAARQFLRHLRASTFGCGSSPICPHNRRRRRLPPLGWRDKVGWTREPSSPTAGG